MKKRKIAIVTGSRADYGLLYWIIKAVHEDPHLALQLIVTGMHLAKEFGLTIKEIKKDNFPIARKVKIPLHSDTEQAIAEAMGFGVIGFAKAYTKLKPDIIVVLGDRFEIYAAVSAALPFRIPVAHIHGGEVTRGMIDNQIRHAITKMSHIHFPAAKEYRKRIIQMGENPKRVYNFGSPAIDNILKLNLLDHKSLCEKLSIPADKKIGVVTYHPVTLETGTSKRHIAELLKAIKNIDGIYGVFTLTNADTGGRVIINRIKNFVKHNSKNTVLHVSLGQRMYLSLLKNATLMAGNSSSGIIEAPSFKLPVVNIGDRQKGRIRALNVIDVKNCEKNLIVKAIKKAISPSFKESLKNLRNPYEKKDASKKIVNKLKKLPLGESLIKKKFFEIE